ncbi:MAG TPA: cystatin domain-containing protein [Pyrinomonadaceae bacterium]|nr:cystatin domain-containing protein [Pyrinomonadaceae bacterium]
MKKNLLTVFLTAVFCAVLSLTANAQKVGGYKSAPTNRADVVTAVSKALEIKSKETEFNLRLDSVEKAETQTVAGTNFRVCMLIHAYEEGETTQSFYVKAVIYRNLKNEFSVTKWDEADDCEESTQ